MNHITCGKRKNGEAPKQREKLLLPVRTNDQLSPSRVKWLGVNPLDWISSLASTLISCGSTNEDPESYQLKEHGQRKRVRIADDLGGDSEVYPTKIDPRSATPPSDGILWDLSFLENDAPFAAGPSERMYVLACEVESIDAGSKYLRGSYKRVQDHLSLTFDWLVNGNQDKSDGSNNERRQLLDNLYTETIQKLESLISMGSGAKPKGTPASSITWSDLNSNAEGSVRTPLKGATPSKKEFSNYMTAWLRDNWTNPYPDDEGLAEMAEACCTTPTIVSNWLINARTRKWRPAIVKAFAMNRSANLLLEDSLNLFDGNPVRELMHLTSTSQGQGGAPVAHPPNKRAKKGA